MVSFGPAFQLRDLVKGLAAKLGNGNNIITVYKIVIKGIQKQKSQYIDFVQIRTMAMCSACYFVPPCPASLQSSRAHSSRHWTGIHKKSLKAWQRLAANMFAFQKPKDLALALAGPSLLALHL